MWKTTETPRLEDFQELGFIREVWALPADESPGARGDMLHLQAV